MCVGSALRQYVKIIFKVDIITKKYNDMNEGGFEKYIYGQVSLLPAEEEAIRKRAIEMRQDPDEAVRIEKERMSQTTRRLREEAHEKAIRETEKTFEEKSRLEKQEE